MPRDQLRFIARTLSIHDKTPCVRNAINETDTHPKRLELYGKWPSAPAM